MDNNEHFSTKKRKEIFIKAFRESFGKVAEACREAKISRGTYYKWIKKKAFTKQLNECIENLKDDIENKLIQKALEGDNACLIFFCKTKLKDRGYVEKQEIEQVGDGVKIDVKISDEIKKLFEEKV
ncbi:MAG: phBC6A51 family helix-turn-helix protein [Candidatus Heimdallarchaeaceae archaeon]